jgi:AraC family transcriptional regulator
VREDGERLLGACSASDLETIGAFMAHACEIQERHVRRLGRWLTTPAATGRRAHLRGGLSPAMLKRVQMFVEANLDRTIQLRDMAARAGLSVYHFARAFRTSAGITPRTYIEQRRLERARTLMEGSNGSLAQIAIASGFGTQSRLTVAFKRQTGFTPSQYRRKRVARPHRLC